ncbi:MAG TPA: dihydrolipoamide acetyltransferase family protein [Actinomycetota bacterium]|nr:dihydrolipoamide acetyltransferase family protein [Actinomycetota bacterium]
MERVFTMPDLGEGLEEGKIVEWLVAEGDTVELNQPFVEVETAKAVVEIPSPFAGTIVALHGTVGEDVPVGDPLATFEVSGSGTGPAEPETASLARVRSLSPDGLGLPPTPHAAGDSAPRATPPVRKLAKSLGIVLDTVAGTGPDGRVTEEDVRASSDGGGGVTAPTRRVIAVNLERQAAIPQVTTFRTVDCSALQAFRVEVGISPLPIVLAAVARTASQHPLLTAVWGGDQLLPRPEVSVGLAVDTDRGLVVPVLHDADTKTLAEIAEDIGRLAEAARSGSLAPEDLTGATIAVSNTGSYGSEAGTPILSPGTSVTLAFGVIQDRALVVDDAVVARPAATISLTFDHRVLDGAAAGRALTDLVALLQSAERLGELPR